MRTIEAHRLPGSRIVTLDEMRYGKLVVAPAGPVPRDEGFATTYLTTGLRQPDQLLPTRLLGGAPLQPDRVDEPFRAGGALLFRLVHGDFVAMRARHRSEIGEGKPGRLYLQARILQMAASRGWSSVPPAFLPWFAQEIASNPDLVGTPASQRIGVAPREWEVFDRPPVSTQELAGDSERQRRLAAIIHAARSASSLTLIGDDAFDDPSARLDVFLDDVALVLTWMGRNDERIAPGFQVACGLSAQAVGHGLVLTSSARSTPQTSVRWDDVMRLAESHMAGEAKRSSQSAAQTTNYYGSNFGPRAVRPSQGTGIAHWAGAPIAGSMPPASSDRFSPDRGRPGAFGDAPSWHATDPADRPAPSEVAPVTPSGPSFRPLETSMARPGGLDVPRDAGSPALSRATGAVSSDIPRDVALQAFRRSFGHASSDPWTANETVARLFDFASDSQIQRAFEAWDPFAETWNKPADLLLALLLGIQGRGALLDRYTLGELFLVKAQWTCVAKHCMVASDVWMEALVNSIYRRIVHLEYLTGTEAGLVRGDNDLRAAGIMDARDVQQIMSDRGKIDSVAKRFDECTGRFRPTDEEITITRLLENRVRKRLQMSRGNDEIGLSYCTLSAAPNEKTVFGLLRRETLRRRSDNSFRNIIGVVESVYRCAD